MIEITVPVLPESVTEGTLTTWCKQEGEHVKRHRRNRHTSHRNPGDAFRTAGGTA